MTSVSSSQLATRRKAVATAAMHRTTAENLERGETNASLLDFLVVNLSTGHTLAAFMLPLDALDFIRSRRARIGKAAPLLDIRNRDGSPISSKLCDLLALAQS